MVVSSTGKLVMVSSTRYKRDISGMGQRNDGLMKLRPVTLRYRKMIPPASCSGLVAEEVARTYPQLVTGGPDGKVETVNYLTLTAMLLNELQRAEPGEAAVGSADGATQSFVGARNE